MHTGGRILCIHGIGQQLSGEETLALQWRAALRDGMRRAGAQVYELPTDSDITIVFYGDLFRGRQKAGQLEPFSVVDIDEGLEAELIEAWHAAALEDEVCGVQPARPVLHDKGGAAPQFVQALARSLLSFKFFSGLTERLLVGNLKQVRSYLIQEEVRRLVTERFTRSLREETRCVVAHSLGSIVAYETLCKLPPGQRHNLITLGSPLGLPNLIFDRLKPAPIKGRGVWPATVRTWTNITDRHDIVASVKQLQPLFGGQLQDITVSNEACAHDAVPYLTAEETGRAILEALYGT